MISISVLALIEERQKKETNYLLFIFYFLLFLFLLLLFSVLLPKMHCTHCSWDTKLTHISYFFVVVSGNCQSELSSSYSWTRCMDKNALIFFFARITVLIIAKSGCNTATTNQKQNPLEYIGFDWTRQKLKWYER